MSKRAFSRFALAALLPGFAALLVAPSAQAFPGFFVGKDDQPRLSAATQIVIMHRDQRTVVTVMTDYDGPSQEFALVMPLPEDVSMDHVVTLKREFVTRIDELTAPRFHEFWEMDPCESGSPEQEWERNLKANADTAFLGGGAPPPGGKAAKEMTLTVEPEFKHASEYTFKLLDQADSANITGWLEKQGYKLPAGTAEAVKPYVDSKQRFLIATVDQAKVELVGDGRAQLSPIRFWTETNYTKIPSTLGLLSSGGKKQELVISVLDAKDRYEAKNYDNVFPPTNLNVDFKVKERMGEFYAALHDKLLAKNPKGILNEYAWSTLECGQPCPNPPLYIHELLSLGADVFEETLSDEVRNPEPPDRTEEEKKVYDEKKKEEKKADDIARKEIARRKALIERHAYTLSRMHHRYDKDSLKQDIEIGPAKSVRGGVELPKGPKGELPIETKAADRNMLQMRYVNLHPDISVLKCDNPNRWRWGKPPRTYRGLRKIWLAEDLATRNRKEIVPEKVVITPVADLGIPGIADEKDPAAAPSASAGTGEEKKSGGCQLSAGATGTSGAAGLGFFAALGLWLRRRRSAK
ncbi:MAG: DUF2330 domain-containing protein [Polyangiaceae bacterium]